MSWAYQNIPRWLQGFPGWSETIFLRTNTASLIPSWKANLPMRRHFTEWLARETACKRFVFFLVLWFATSQKTSNFKRHLFLRLSMKPSVSSSYSTSQDTENQHKQRVPYKNNISQPMVNWWSGLVVWIPGISLMKGIGILRGTGFESQATTLPMWAVTSWPWFFCCT